MSPSTWLPVRQSRSYETKERAKLAWKAATIQPLCVSRSASMSGARRQDRRRHRMPLRSSYIQPGLGLLWRYRSETGSLQQSPRRSLYGRVFLACVKTTAASLLDGSGQHPRWSGSRRFPVGSSRTNANPSREAWAATCLASITSAVPPRHERPCIDAAHRANRAGKSPLVQRKPHRPSYDRAVSSRHESKLGWCLPRPQRVMKTWPRHYSGDTLGTGALPRLALLRG